MRVLAVDTCPHWDMHILDGRPMFPGRHLTYPYTVGQPGHEAVGIIEAVGPDVRGLEPGMRVAAWRDQGHNRPGCYAQYVIMDAGNVLPVPAEIPLERVASLELAMCVQVAFDALLNLGLIQGKRIGIMGLGGAGLIAVQMARAYGAAEIIGFDPIAERRNLARQIGAHGSFPPEAEAWPSDRFGPRALDAAVECTGLVPAIEFAMDRTRHAVALFGVHRQDFRYGFRHRGLWVIGYGRHNRQSAEKALNLILHDKLDLSPLVGARLPLTQYRDGIELLRSGAAIKIMYLPNAGQ